MRILSVKYPKSKLDEEKLDYLTDTYNKYLKYYVEREPN